MREANRSLPFNSALHVHCRYLRKKKYLNSNNLFREEEKIVTCTTEHTSSYFTPYLYLQLMTCTTEHISSYFTPYLYLQLMTCTTEHTSSYFTPYLYLQLMQ
ncbi:hypothetical protein VCUG_01540 [Vavraia culicis subsp. floridensis]|uniref:Uncharacterized protein n=1 Tax=Vavraia culicis (isolate floridensis) TaxID=948595 RepID=L2GTR6_VAVCU|nr:uncharacterized protein VCUG_01540 [Vavraia culicis subsp. floridensis]ELA47009.1 hypothetical protein VCUG_01540 [Vavraia culicis subsp. floridensis]